MPVSLTQLNAPNNLEVTAIVGVAVFAIGKAFDLVSSLRNRKNHRPAWETGHGERLASLEARMDSEISGIHRELATIRGQLAVMGRLEQARTTEGH